MRIVVGVFALAACGRSPSPTVVSAPVAPPSPTGPTAADFCRTYAALQSAGCPLGAKQMGADACLQRFGPDPATVIAAENAGRPSVDCVLAYPVCEDVNTCLRMANDLAKPRTCGESEPEGAAISVTPAEYAQRNGSRIQRFSDVHSTFAAPVERCGIPDETTWIGSLACDDGSHPLLVPGNFIETKRRAENTRLGSEPDGGRCKSIIDTYRVQCHGQPTVDVFVDAYVCPH